MTPQYGLKRTVTAVWGDWRSSHLWQRIVKYMVCLTAAIIVAMHPASVSVLGPNTFLVPMVVVFAHPGQRMGQMVESVLLLLCGGLLGIGWSLLGLWLSSLVYASNRPAAYTVRGVFFLVSILIHGFVRSSSPRLLPFLLFLVIPGILTLLGEATAVTLDVATDFLYPFLIGSAIIFPANLLIFPELSSSSLGWYTMATLAETMDTLDRATFWFVTPGGDSKEAIREKRSATKIKRATRKKTGFWRELRAEFPNPFRLHGDFSPAEQVPLLATTLASITDRKSKLRARLGNCKAVQDEANFELSISPLAPISMRPISDSFMTSMVQSTITLIGACENKFLVLEANAHLQAELTATNEDNASQQGSLGTAGGARSLVSSLWGFVPGARGGRSNLDESTRTVENVKPLRELEMGNADLLESILGRIREPVQELQHSMQEAVALVMSCLSYSFDVETMPSGCPAPRGISLEEIDLRIDTFTEALELFDDKSSEELRRAAMDRTGESVDLMPRLETFLVSSFILGFRQSSDNVVKMLRHARNLVEERQARRDRSTVWFPKYTNKRAWMLSGGEREGLSHPEAVWKTFVEGHNAMSTAIDASGSGSDQPLVHHLQDEEAPAPEIEKASPNIPKSAKVAESGCTLEKKHWTSSIRGKLADCVDFLLTSKDIAYALKLAIAIFAVSWPALVDSLHSWYAEVRGAWAPLQLIFVFEVAIGSSLFTISIRLVGVAYGCIMGYVAYEIGRGIPAPVIVVYVIAAVPAIYVHLATKYQKAGMICIVSLSVVAIATTTKAGAPVQIFYKRLVAFLIGSLVAIVVEVFIYPVRARDRLVESLSATVEQVQKMHCAISIGVDGPERPDFRSDALYTGFVRARNKAEAALGAAESFLPFCLTEPRLKGSFKKLAPIYREVIYVLHQIIDRVNNVIQLRMSYGSSILEDLNPQVYAYRRNVAAGIILMLFSVNEALTTWLPLPQFLPSARVAHLRLINRVREVLAVESSKGTRAGLPKSLVDTAEVDEQTARVITQRNFLSWNASTAGQMEIIEYVEELVELTKLLVGVNAFRSGMLERPTYQQYLLQLKTSEHGLGKIRSTLPTGSTAPQDGKHAPEQSSGDTERGLGLSAIVSMAQSVERARDRLKKNKSNTGTVDEALTDGEGLDDSDNEEEIPQSLRRVGTRLWQDDSTVRRRRFTLDAQP